MSKCPVCSKEMILKYKLSSDVLYCNTCDLYVAPEVKFNKSFYSDINQDKAALALKELRISNFKKIINHLKADYPQKVNGLDVGCSYGWFLDLCRENNISCIGVEPEPAIAAQAKQSGHTIIQGFFPDDLNGQVTSADFIIFNDVFEHIPDIHKTLESCYQLLAPNGTLIINIPLSTGFFYRTARLLYRLNYKMPLERMWQFHFHSPHFHYFNKDNLTQLAQSKGFKLSRFHHLDTITKESIQSRIEMNRKQTFSSKMMISALKLIYPAINKMPSDIGCFYFKKA